MREILFRAKRIDNGEWVYGTPYQEYNDFWGEWIWKIQTKHPITNVPFMNLEVDKRTICQFTGLTDENNIKIFEGDILEWNPKEYGKEYFELVEWKYDLLGFREEDWGQWCSVAGNIFENSKLLETK